MLKVKVRRRRQVHTRQDGLCTVGHGIHESPAYNKKRGWLEEDMWKEMENTHVCATWQSWPKIAMDGSGDVHAAGTSPETRSQRF